MTYNAVLKDGYLEWIDPPPDYNPAEPLNVQIEIVAPEDDKWDKQIAADSAAGKLDPLMFGAMLDHIAQRGNVASAITDPLAWQREIRQDRELPGRND